MPVDPDSGEIFADVVAEDTLDEIQVAMEKRGGFALLAALLDFVPGLAEEFDIGANFFVGGSAGRGSNDEAAGISAASFADQTTQTRAIIGGRDFARYADVVDRGHVDQEATRQCHVAGDASAFFAERLLGDLDDDVLPGLQPFGNELRAARRSGVAAIMHMLGAAGAPFESRTSAGTAASTIWPAATASSIVSAAIIAIPSAAAAAERPLESSSRIAAYARGVTREIKARLGTARARCAGFAREQDAVGFCYG